VRKKWELALGELKRERKKLLIFIAQNIIRSAANMRYENVFLSIKRQINWIKSAKKQVKKKSMQASFRKHFFEFQRKVLRCF